MYHALLDVRIVLLALKLEKTIFDKKKIRSEINGLALYRISSTAQ